MGAKRKSYTPKYRQEAAHLVIDTGRTIVEVAREIGVGEQLLGKWVAIERSRIDDPPAALDADGVHRSKRGLGVLTIGFAYEWRKGALEWA